MFIRDKKEFFCDICYRKIDGFIYDLKLYIGGEKIDELDICENCLPFVQLTLRNFKNDVVEMTNNYRFYFWERAQVLKNIKNENSEKNE